MIILLSVCAGDEVGTSSSEIHICSLCLLACNCRIDIITINVPVGGRNDFDAGDIHYKGHWKGWALKWP